MIIKWFVTIKSSVNDQKQIIYKNVSTRVLSENQLKIFRRINIIAEEKSVGLPIRALKIVQRLKRKVCVV